LEFDDDSVKIKLGGGKERRMELGRS